jgi:hypothetical protein
VKLSKKQYVLVERLLENWVQRGLLSSDQKQLLSSDIGRKAVNWHRVAQNMLGLAVFFMVVAFFQLVADEWVLRLLENFVALSDGFFMVLLGFLTVTFILVAWFVHKSAKVSSRIFEEALLLMSGLSFGGMLYYAHVIFEWQQGTQIMQLFMGAVMLLCLGYCFRSSLLWLLGWGLFFFWVGLQTAYADDWNSVFWGMNLAVRYLVFSAVFILVLQGLKELGCLRRFFSLTLQLGLLLMWFSFWMCALFGNYASWEAWESASSLQLLPWGMAMAALAFYFWWAGRRKKRQDWVWMGSLAFFADACTQYFLFLWEPLPPVLFFFILAVLFFVIGRKAEVICGK